MRRTAIGYAGQPLLAWVIVTHQATTHPGLCLLGAGTEARHSLLLRGIASGASITLVDHESSWARPHVACTVPVDLTDVDAITEALSGLANHEFSTIATYHDSHLELAAELNHRLGLPGLPRHAARVARDKHAQREKLTATSTLPIGSKIVYDAAEGRCVAEELGYPVVVKPRNLSGNLGVHIAGSGQQLDDFFAATMSTPDRGLGRLGGLLIEEYLDGPEFSIDCWILDGQAGVLSLAEIFVDHAPVLIDTGSVVGQGTVSPDTEAALGKAACEAAVACGLDRTIANVDVKLVNGKPRILEVNGRPGGLLPRLALLTSGTSIGEAFANVALGRRPRAPRPPASAAGFVFVYAPRAMIFGGLRLPNITGQPWMHHLHLVAREGQRVAPTTEDPWGHVAWMIVTGETASAVRNRLEMVWRTAEVVERR